jgi:hypothetical protein
MLVTRNLGYRYLWVDRYCIPQTDDAESRAIRNHQVRVMDAIYANAVCTIIDAASDDSESGLPGVSQRPRVGQRIKTVGDWQLIGLPLIEREIMESRWAQRGWTYQEGALSRRRLVFTKSQIYFQCHSKQWLECLSFPWPFDSESQYPGIPVLYMESFNSHDYKKGIFRTISDYFKRQLTFPSDRLYAFLGFLNHMKTMGSVYHLMGLPLIPLPRQNEHGSSQSSDFSEQRLVESHVACSPPPIAQNLPLHSLAAALAWTLYLAFEPPNLRRVQGFPSSTWLGWKCDPKVGCSYTSVNLDAFESQIISIDVLFSVGQHTQVPWSALSTTWICDQVETQLGASLKITGFLCELPLKIQTLSREPEFVFSNREKELTPFLRDHDITDVLPLSGGRLERTFTCLLLGIQPFVSDKSLKLLVLRELPEENAFERLNIESWTVQEPFTVLDDGTASLHGISFRRGTVLVN